MEVVIIRPFKPPPPPLSQSNTTPRANSNLSASSATLEPGKKKNEGTHHQETTPLLSDKILGKMPIRSSSKTLLPPPSIPSTGHKEDNANATSSSSTIPVAATESLVPVPSFHAIPLSTSGEGSDDAEATDIRYTDTPHLPVISYLTSRASSIITDASNNNTLTCVLPFSLRLSCERRRNRMLIIMAIGP